MQPLDSKILAASSGKTSRGFKCLNKSNCHPLLSWNRNSYNDCSRFFKFQTTTVRFNHRHGRGIILGSRRHHVATSPKKCRFIIGARGVASVTTHSGNNIIRKVRSVEDRTHRHRNHKLMCVIIVAVGPKCAIIKWTKSSKSRRLSWWLCRIWLTRMRPARRHVPRWWCLPEKGRSLENILLLYVIFSVSDNVVGLTCQNKIIRRVGLTTDIYYIFISMIYNHKLLLKFMCVPQVPCKKISFYHIISVDLIETETEITS